MTQQYHHYIYNFTSHNGLDHESIVRYYYKGIYYERKKGCKENKENTRAYNKAMVCTQTLKDQLI